MARRKKHRNISGFPKCRTFKPVWVPQKDLETVVLFLDEYEALRLADKEWHSMQEWAEKMWISAPTFNRLLQSAHKKIANAFIDVQAIEFCVGNEDS